MAYDHLSDEALVERSLRGEDGAFAALIGRYVNAVYAVVRRYVQDRDRAADIVQETFIKVWRNLARFDTARSFRAWLYVIAERTALDWLRGRETPFSEMKAEAEHLPGEGDLAGETDVKLGVEKIYAEIKKLAPEVQVIVRLHAEEGLTFREIGARLGKSLHTVKSIYRRTILALQVQFSGEFA